jgi:hypothetical protein
MKRSGMHVFITNRLPHAQRQAFHRSAQSPDYAVLVARLQPCKARQQSITHSFYPFNRNNPLSFVFYHDTALK